MKSTNLLRSVQMFFLYILKNVEKDIKFYKFLKEKENVFDSIIRSFGKIGHLVGWHLYTCLKLCSPKSLTYGLKTKSWKLFPYFASVMAIASLLYVIKFMTNFFIFSDKTWNLFFFTMIRKSLILCVYVNVIQKLQ